MSRAQRGISDLNIETIDHDGVEVMALNGDIDIIDVGQARIALRPLPELRGAPSGRTHYDRDRALAQAPYNAVTASPKRFRIWDRSR